MADIPDTDDPQDELAPSKSERKRQMHALQRLGEFLLTLNAKQLAEVPVTDETLLEALRDMHRIRSNNARKRQLQYIGKLMREIDPEPIERARDSLHQRSRAAAADFQQLEALRDAALAAGPKGTELIMQRFADADRQHLRQLILQHQRELQGDKPPAASRKLFRYLKSLRD